MKWIFLLSLLLAGSVRALEKDGFEYSDSQIAEMEAALRALDDLARKAAAEPSPALIPELGNGVFKTSQPSIYAVGDRLGVRRRLQDVLLAIPGHAEYYRDSINKAQERYDGAVGAADKGFLGHALFTARRDALLTLKELPSSETLQVLGEMLFDERGRIALKPDRSNLKEFVSQDPTCDQVARVLAEMIENPPVLAGQYVGLRDLPTWRSWYERVKSGKQAVRFKEAVIEVRIGDATSSPKGTRPERSLPVQPVQAPEKGRVASAADPRLIAIALVILAGGASLLYLRKKK